MNADEITSAKSEGPLRADADGLLRHADIGGPAIPGQPASPARQTDSIVIKIDADTAGVISSLEETRLKLIEIEQQAERTAAALAKVKI